ncbi:MAG: hypothetical protein ACYTAN_14010 [Planctomycetota bacterium]
MTVEDSRMKWSFALRCILVPIAFACSIILVPGIVASLRQSPVHYHTSLEHADFAFYEGIRFAFASFFPILVCGAIAPSQKELMATLAALVYCVLLLLAGSSSRYSSVEMAVLEAACVALALFLSVEILHAHRASARDGSAV